MQDMGLPELSSEQIEQLCTVAEEAARKYILSKISKKEANRIDVAVEAVGAKPVNLEVEIDLELSPQSGVVDSAAIVNEAIREAFKAGESFLRKLV